MAIKDTIERIERAQQENTKLAVAAATVKKYGEDQSAGLANGAASRSCG